MWEALLFLVAAVTADAGRVDGDVSMPGDVVGGGFAASGILFREGFILRSGGVCVGHRSHACVGMIA